MHSGRVASHSGAPTRQRVHRPSPISPGAPTVAPTNELALAGDPPPPPRRILVVDDNRANANSLGVLLRRSARTSRWPTTARPPSTGEPNRPDLVLLDIGLPGMDGYEVARRCREDKDLHRIMLVAMTGYGKEEDRRRSQKPASTPTSSSPSTSWTNFFGTRLNQPDLPAL